MEGSNQTNRDKTSSKYCAVKLFVYTLRDVVKPNIYSTPLFSTLYLLLSSNQVNLPKIFTVMTC